MAISCDNSIEGQIEKEFKHYVELNFDNPKDITEIVSVQLTDTTCYSRLKNAMEMTFDILEQTEEIYEIKQDMQMKRFREILATREGDLSEDYRARLMLQGVMQGISKHIAYVEEYALDKSYYTKKKAELIDSTKVDSDYAIVCNYKIKFRQKENENILMKEYFCYQNIALEPDLRKLIIQDQEMELDEISDYDKTLGEMMDITLKTLKLNEAYKKVCDERYDAIDKFIGHIEMNTSYK